MLRQLALRIMQRATPHLRLNTGIPKRAPASLGKYIPMAGYDEHGLHFGFFPLWLRVVRAGIVGAFMGINRRHDLDTYSGVRPSLLKVMPEINERVYRECDEDLALSLKHTTRIIQQAFRDARFKGPVHVRITGSPDDMKDNTPLNAGCLEFRDEHGVSSALVEIKSYPKKVANHDEYYMDAYATGGHEAIHALHRHQIWKAVLEGALLGFSPILGMIYLDNFNQQIARLCEIDADVTSAWKLGTAEERKRTLAKAGLYFAGKKSGNEKFMPDTEHHPLLQTRVKYMSFLCPLFRHRQNLFLNSETYREISEERKSRLKC